MKNFIATGAKALILILILSGCANQKEMINKETVKTLELDKYLGTWYEIARFPHSFEKGLVGVTATYSLREDGKIKVVNKGFKNSLEGEESIAIGKAKIPDPAFPARLKVSFFWIFYADYLVMDLDENYEWALIGSKSPNYLWILSRTPQLDEKLYQELLKKLEDRGYNLDQLIKVEQKAN
ncbi:MAG: lipocalin family protein [Bacteroidetes bacterium]|jgi:apolipoprotein D and lipocalin family protein|nr:lipocalin family protein [Bacteroidota bacterium]MBT5531093.1 lipocalin family protein [Cytophagia bacterium]MBT4338068.1 lipocalin family protein [Bacteroidota bacterium]MBT4727273.1 lipocalin family protein [Bacteroidota bacterium]MBT4969950.1 lipocalin family protein [Bacteroidota bacterium]